MKKFIVNLLLVMCLILSLSLAILNVYLFFEHESKTQYVANTVDTPTAAEPTLEPTLEPNIEPTIEPVDEPASVDSITKEYIPVTVGEGSIVYTEDGTFEKEDVSAPLEGWYPPDGHIAERYRVYIDSWPDTISDEYIQDVIRDSVRRYAEYTRVIPNEQHVVVDDCYIENETLYKFSISEYNVYGVFNLETYMITFE